MNRKNFIVMKFRGFAAGRSVAKVTHCVTKIIPPCSAVIGQFFDTMIVASIENSGYNGTSKSKSLNVLETVLSHLKSDFPARWKRDYH